MAFARINALPWRTKPPETPSRTLEDQDQAAVAGKDAHNPETVFSDHRDPGDAQGDPEEHHKDTRHAVLPS